MKTVGVFSLNEQLSGAVVFDAYRFADVSKTCSYSNEQYVSNYLGG